MPSLKFTPRNLEKLGIILMVLLLVFRPGFVKKFSNNLIGKMLLLGAIVSVASHNKMYGLLAAFTYVVCVEMTSEGNDVPSNKTNKMSDDQDKSSLLQQLPCGQRGSDWNAFFKPFTYECSKQVLQQDGSCTGPDLSGVCCVPTPAQFKEFETAMDAPSPEAKNEAIAKLNLLPCQKEMFLKYKTPILVL